MRLLSRHRGSLFAGLVASIAALPAAAEPWSLDGNLAFTSDYLFRGVSQTDRGPAIQGSLNLSSDTGFYTGVWGSNIGFGDGSMELDLHAGWSGAITEVLSTDLGVIRYEYPKGDSNNAELSYNELYASLGYGDLTVGLNGSPDYFGADVDQYLYYYLQYDRALTEHLAVGAHWGLNQFDNAGDMTRFLGIGSDEGNAYADWQVSATFAILEGLDLSLAYSDTDIPRAQCDDLCNEHWTLTLDRSF